MSFRRHTALGTALLASLLLAQQPANLAGETARDETRPLPLTEPRPSPATVAAWKDHRFGMFIHFGLYSKLGGVWQGKQIDNGYSEQIMANAPIPRDQYAALARQFNPEHFDADAVVALAKAAGMRFIVITAKHHDGFAMFDTHQSDYNIVDATPYHRDIVKELSDACKRGGLAFGVYYSTIDWHAPTGSPYIEGNSNPISDAHASFNVAQLRELLTGYGPLSEIWFDMGKPTPEQSKRFVETVHGIQPQTMVSGRVFNYEGDFTVMGDNQVPKFAIDEPWQTPASIFADTWGYRSWEKRGDASAKIHEKLLELVTVVSRGGNYILNIGPEGDGSVVPFEADVLRGMGTWVHANGEAIFGTNGHAPAASPFRNLDFGFATLGQQKLYLIVSRLPADGHLSLPGVLPPTQFGKPYLLGSDSTRTGSVGLTPEGATVDLTPLASQLSGADLPVLVLPFSGTLAVRPSTTIRPGPGKEIQLAASTADRFLNFNGRGYEDPATVYKLRWFLATPPGRYHAELHYTRPPKPARMTLVVGDQHLPVTLPAGSGPGVWSADLTLVPGPTATGHDETIEITPTEPFYKGTALPVEIHELRLTPLR